MEQEVERTSVRATLSPRSVNRFRFAAKSPGTPPRRKWDSESSRGMHSISLQLRSRDVLDRSITGLTESNSLDRRSCSEQSLDEVVKTGRLGVDALDVVVVDKPSSR